MKISVSCGEESKGDSDSNVYASQVSVFSYTKAIIHIVIETTNNANYEYLCKKGTPSWNLICTHTRDKFVVKVLSSADFFA